MPSPFPGMDPFIEDQEWQDFHNRFNIALSDAVAPGVAPKYVVRIERRIYVEWDDVYEDQLRLADVAVAMATEPHSGAPQSAAAGGLALAPVECVLAMPEERRESYLVIRERDSMRIVTVIETLSPANKRPGSTGREQYLEKRAEIHNSQAHLVELDLLRGGARLPMKSGLPLGDYYTIVSRRYRRPRVEVFPWTIRQPMPTIPIPLSQGEPDALINLQDVFSAVYDRAHYELSLNYRAPLETPLTPDVETWAASLLQAAP